MSSRKLKKKNIVNNKRKEENELKEDKTESKDSSISILSVFTILVPIIVIIYAIIYIQYRPDNYQYQSSEINILDSEWLADSDFLEENQNLTCDFPEITEAEIRKNPRKYMGSPFVLRNVASEWPATRKWKRSELLDKFGKRTIVTGSEGSIVYGGGAASVTLTLDQIMNRIRNKTDLNSSDLFSFDVSILKSIPELRKDFYVPDLFKTWDNIESEKHGYSWNMLSLGPSKSGYEIYCS